MGFIQSIGGCQLKSKWKGALKYSLACLSLAGLLSLSESAFAACKLVQLGELPVKVEDNRILVGGSVDGKPVRMMVDTGSGDNMIYRDAARRLGLPLLPLRGVTMYGVGGEVRLRTTQVKTLTLGNLVSHNEVMLVGGDDPDGDPAIIGMLGERFFSQADIEFDLAGGVIRFLKPQGCTDAQLAYWATTSYSQVAIDGTNNAGASIDSVAKLNGLPIAVTFDTGSTNSVVTLTAAQAVGVRPGGEGVTRVGRIYGAGPKSLPVWIGTFKTFSLGDETIGNAKLRISDLFAFNKEVSAVSVVPVEVGSQTKMFIGLDFFKSHRVLISQSRRKMYFTYAGGPVFDTRADGDVPDPPAPPR